MSVLLGIGDWLYGLVSIFPKLLYFITMSFVTLLDLFQFAVRKLAGLDVYYVNGVSEQSGDIAFAFIRSIFDANSTMPALKNAFWALMVLAVIMLVLATIIAVIRSEYSGGDNNKNKVISNAVKSLFMFLIVPVSVFFGLLLGNIFLVAIDKATSTGGYASPLLSNEVTSKLQASEVAGHMTYTNYDIFSGALPSSNQTLSGIVFRTSAFNANRARMGEIIDGKNFSQHLSDGTIGHLGLFQNAESTEERAQMIDDAFANNVVFNDSAGVVRLQLGAFKGREGVGAWKASNNMRVRNLSKFNVPLVWVYYDLWQFNFLIAFVFVFALMKVMTNVIVGLIKRIIEVTALFIISPPIVATMPLDDGKTFGKWRETFLARAISVFAIVFGFNVFFLIIPYIQKINFFDPTVNMFKFLNILVNSFFIVVALQSIESMIAVLSKMIGADDLNKAGDGLSKAVTSTMKQTAMIGAGVAGVAGRAFGGVAKGIDKATGSVVSGTAKKALHRAHSFGGKDKKEVEDEKEKAGQDFDAESGRKYDQEMQGNEGYQQEMQGSYNREVQDGQFKGSFEEFMQDQGEVATTARETAATNYANQHGTRESYVESQRESKDRQKYVAQRANQKREQIFHEKRSGDREKGKVGQALSSAKSKMGSVGGYVNTTFGLNKLTKTAEGVFGGVVKSTIRDDDKTKIGDLMKSYHGQSMKQIKKGSERDSFMREQRIKDEEAERIRREREQAQQQENQDEE